MSIHIVIPDSHAHYKHSNHRAIWLGKLITDVRPDCVINLGDTADMPSLSSYDKGKRSFQGRSYSQDVAAHGDFQEKLWGTVRKSKRKLPRRITLIGNHEQRIDRAIEHQPELAGTIGYEDLELDRWYSDVVPYEGQTPGTICVDGIHYAHYFISGVQGRPLGGEHPAYTLLGKKFASCTQGHSHTSDYCVRQTEAGRRIQALVAGCYVDYHTDWAGTSNRLWWRGVVVKRGVSDGSYDPEFISIERLKREYGP